MKMVLISYIILLSATAFTESRVYFSPHGGCEKHTVEMIQGTKDHLDIAMYSLNNQTILLALEDAKDRKVDIRILLDRVQAFGNREETLRLKNEGIHVRMHSRGKIQHNKFSVSDGQLVMTGSFNWTTPAENANEENCIFLNDPEIVQTYQNHFDHHLWADNTERKSRRYFNKLKQREKTLPSYKGNGDAQ